MKEIIIEKIQEGYLVTDLSQGKNTSWYRRHFAKLEDVMIFVKNHYR